MKERKPKSATTEKGKTGKNAAYDLAVTSTYWPGRKCAAYRGVPEHTRGKTKIK